MTEILVVDDDTAMVRALCINLRARGYTARGATMGREGLALAGRFHFDAVLLDTDVRDLPGLDIIAGIRGWSSVPIIVMSEKDSELAKIAALDAGADDYVTKPLAMGELLARVRAVLRRSRNVKEDRQVTTDHFTIDLAAKRVTTACGDVPLTRTEWRLVEILVRNAGKVVSREQLLREVWGPDFESQTQYLRVYFAQIRRKLEPVPCRPRYFLTLPGLGLRFEGIRLGTNDRTEGVRVLGSLDDAQTEPVQPALEFV